MTLDTPQAQANATLLNLFALIGEQNARLTPRHLMILSYLAVTTKGTQKEIVEALKIPQTTLSSALAYLQDLEWVDEQEPDYIGGQYAPKKYHLNKKGETFVKLLCGSIITSASK